MKQLLFGVVAVLLSTTVFSQLTVIPKVGSSFATFSKSDDLLAGLEKPGYKFL